MDKVYLSRKKDTGVWDAALRRNGKQVGALRTGESDRDRAVVAAQVKWPGAEIVPRRGPIEGRGKSKPGPKPGRKPKPREDSSPLAMFREYVEAEVRSRMSEKIDDLMAILQSWRENG